MTSGENAAADRFYRAEIVERASALRKGAKLDIAKTDGADRYAALSFAGIYALVVWFDDAFGSALVKARIRRALPNIERLTLSLPPSGGPGADEGAGKIRA
jgi:hypothetical protein